MYNTDDYIDKVIVAAIETDSGKLSAERSLDELSELVDTSGGKVLERLIQRRENVHPAHYFGKGKIEELKDLISLTEANGIVCDDELSSTQQKNLAEALSVKVMDRTMVILDIFAKHATTREGKVQVELAQLKYNRSHLKGIGTQLSRLGGGIGTRGPGEKKLEVDRRTIDDRIAGLKSDLKEIERHRSVTRERRVKSQIPVVALIGYTNAGKSTLMNAVSEAGVLVMDKLFATLDTTSRKVVLPGGQEAVFSDTVGFIQKLPHNIIEAFKATLEELRYADILLHVVDASSPVREEQMQVVKDTINAMSHIDKKIITVYNKIDIDTGVHFLFDKKTSASIGVSALFRNNISELLSLIEMTISESRQIVKLFIPFNEGGALNKIYGNCEVLEEIHNENGTEIRAYCDDRLKSQLHKYLI